jgi:hypothetical protein
MTYVTLHGGLLLTPARSRELYATPPRTIDKNAVAILRDSDAVRTNRALIAPDDTDCIASARPFTSRTAGGVRGGTTLIEYRFTDAEIPRPSPDDLAARMRRLLVLCGPLGLRRRTRHILATGYGFILLTNCAASATGLGERRYICECQMR